MFLGDKSAEDYGKQKCWGSIGWGGFSIFIGWLVDIFSYNKKDKDYSPVFYSSILITALNLGVANKIKVRRCSYFHLIRPDNDRVAYPYIAKYFCHSYRLSKRTNPKVDGKTCVGCSLNIT